MKKFFGVLFCCLLLLNSKVYAQQDKLNSLQWAQYRAYVEQTVRANWRPRVTQINAKSQSIVVHLQVDRMGNLGSVQIVSTVDEDMARSVKRAVINSAPFQRPPAFPLDYISPYADVDFTFDLVLKEFGPMTRILESDFHKQVYNQIEDKDLKNEYMDYLKQVQTSLRTSSFKKMPPAQALLQFDVSNNGEIQNATVVTPSKNPEFDKAALKFVQALKISAPPVHLNLNTLTIQCVISNANGIITPGRI